MKVINVMKLKSGKFMELPETNDILEQLEEGQKRLVIPIRIFGQGVNGSYFPLGTQEIEVFRVIDATPEESTDVKEG